jgi:transcription elongation factor GreA
MELPIVARLKKELATLQYELTFQLPKELEEARAHGDLSENAEWEAAKERQDFVRSRIRQLSGRIRELSMYNIASIPHGVVAYGSRVTLEDVDQGGESRYEIVFPEEVDAGKGLISISSPLGRGLLNRREGDEVEVQTPGGKRSYQIVELKTYHDR